MNLELDNALLAEEADEGVLLLTMNRPAQRNAIDIPMLDAMNAAFDAFAQNDRWRVGVLTGAKPAFCAGLDLKTFSAPDAPRHTVTALIRRVPHLGKPIIAAVDGAAYTGGLELALGCDFILASEDARFADTHAKIGALSGSGMGSRLPHAVGARFARQMMLSCQPIDAATALRVGLVNELLPAGEVLPRALEIAKAIAAHDPELLRMAKSVIDRGTETTLAEALAIETETLRKCKAMGGMTWSSAASAG
ncbi:Enoyl-CoA hydratase/isomerase [Sphingobium chlorophenolicum L-1]|uniref:Enoyl-CoA hydratase/isomerase n=1 Tax=Sphingobium chlorophenolicum L-1 TaxID=690566 RepID=F6F0Y7_SPHCR|nr:enoyl-CoA hydratase-related protein [Sphingobium chlorophenolicum]AEG51203.1 Enoyl-CoA hydratase/isomerase [Sphingobium chlorophenolicum L-1]